MAEENSTELATRHKHLIEAPSHNYIHRATSDNTRKAYQTDIRHLMAWGGLLPTTPDVIIQYLESNAEILNSRTLTRRLTALKNWHNYQGFPDPTSHPLVRKTLTGIKNVHGKPKDKAPAMTLETLITMCEHLQRRGGQIDLRNIALLQIGFFGAFRRCEEAAGISQGPIFRQISKKGDISDIGISPARVNITLKSIAQDCNLPDAEFYSAHSLRRGFATQASKNGAPFGSIMQQGRWKHEGTVLGYIEEGKRFEGNAVSSILNKSEQDKK